MFFFLFEMLPLRVHNIERLWSGQPLTLFTFPSTALIAYPDATTSATLFMLVGVKQQEL